MPIILDNKTISGTRVFGPVIIPDDISSFGFYLGRESWVNPLDKVAVNVELSLDGGTKWNNLLTFRASGNPDRSRCGVMHPLLPRGIKRQVRMTVIITGVIKTSVSFELNTVV